MLLLFKSMKNLKLTLLTLSLVARSANFRFDLRLASSRIFVAKYFGKKFVVVEL